MPHTRLTLLFLLICLTLSGKSQEQPHVFKGATLITISNGVITNGAMVVQNGKIAAVGAAETTALPADAVVIDVTGKTIMPGLVDTHSHLGRVDGGDRSATLHPDVRALDAIDVKDTSLKKALAGGITTLNIMPGSGYLMSGQTAYLKLRNGQKIEDLLYCNDPLTEICGGMKMANGTNPLGDPPFSGTRAKSAALVRQLFIKAQEYKAKIVAAHGDPQKMPERDLQMEALVEVLDGKRIVHHHTHRHDDILTVLRLQKEFGFRVVLHHVSEGWKVAEEIAAVKIPCSIIYIDSPGGKLEAVNLLPQTGAVLEKAGVDVAFHTDDGITDSRLFFRSAAFAVRYGMSREKALEGLTLAGARMLDLQDRIGSLTPGKDADFIILSGDPLSVYTVVEQTWVEGQKRFDITNPEDRNIATGGYKVFRDHFHTHENRGGDVE